MGTTTKLYPTSSVATSNVTASGQPTPWQALADASSSTWATFALNPAGAYVRAEVADYTLASGSAIHGVRVVARMDAVSGGSIRFHLRLESAGADVADLRYVTTAYSSATVVESPYSITNAAGLPWDQSRVNNARINLYDEGTGTNAPRVFNAYLEVLSYAKPVTSAISPSGTLSALPTTVSWSFNGDGLTQAAVEARVFSEATATAAGFDPSTSAGRLWELTVYTSVTSLNFDSGLSGPLVIGDGNYRCYVRTATLVSGQYFWGDWAYSSFTLSRPPGLPALLAPANGGKVDGASPITFQWTYTHQDPTMAMAAWAFRRKTSPTGSYQYYRQSDDSWQSTLQWNSGAVTSWQFAGGVFSNGSQYWWSVATQAANGTASMWGALVDISFYATPKPTVAITSPAATVTSTTRPVISWTYSEATAALQEQWQVVIYPSWIYSVAGFYPGVTPSPFDGDSGVNAGVASQWQPPNDLNPSATYRAYVRASGNGLWSDWQYVQFVFQLDVPVAPTVTVSFDNALVANAIAIQAHVNLLTENASSVETDASGWTAGTGAGSLSRQSTAAHGSYGLRFSSTVAGSASVRTVAAVSVVAGKQYTARAAVRSETTARQFRTSIYWFKSGGAASSVTPVSTGASVSSLLGAWVDSASSPGVTATAPSDAVTALVEVTALSCAIGDQFTIDKAALFNGAPSFDKWQVGGLSGSVFSPVVAETANYGYPRVSPALSSTFSATAYDYEVTPRRAAQYSVSIAGPLPGQPTSTVASAATSATATAWAPASWYLREVPGTAVAAVRVLEGLSLRQPLQGGVFYPAGSERAVVIADPTKWGSEGTLQLWALSEAECAALDALLSPGKTLLLQDPVGQTWYVQVTQAVDREFMRVWDAALPRAWAYKYSVPVVEVERP